MHGPPTLPAPSRACAASRGATCSGGGSFTRPNLGKLSFYLEALDRDVKKPHENPAIGVLLCASKDDEVVEYALSRTASPALIAQYETQLPDKALLQAKLHEFYLLNMAGTEGEA
jgi:hypothetical protein